MSEAEPQNPAPRRRLLAAGEAGARHVLLTVGFGVVALVGGMVFMGSMLHWLAARVDLSWGPLPWVMTELIDSGWVLGVLPAMTYLSARFMELKPWSTAGIGAASGLTFQIALLYVSAGEEGLIGSPLRLVLRLASVAGGVVLTARAVKRGRASAQVAEARARVEAEKKKSQYDEFVKRSEVVADRRDPVPLAPQPDGVKSDAPVDEAAKNGSP